MVNKIYCFVDETGQDTKGKFFLVAVVISGQEQLEILEKNLTDLEIDCGKSRKKWHGLDKKIKKNYLEGLLKLKELKQSIFYSTYKDSKSYTPLLALTIAKSINKRNAGDYQASIIIDGLNTKEKDIVRKELKLLKIKYHNIKGLKDQQNPVLRLADAMAGFLRDYYEDKKYGAELYLNLTQGGKVVSI